MFGHIAGTAAGVAAGTVIGDKITGRNEPAPSHEATPVNPAHGPCKYEEEQILNCIQSQTDLQTCDIYKKALSDCKYKHSMIFRDTYLLIDYYYTNAFLQHNLSLCRYKMKT